MTVPPQPLPTGPSTWEIAAPTSARTLDPAHLTLLTDSSGIDAEVVTSRGYYSPTAHQIAMMVQLELVDPAIMKSEAWLSIPVHRPDGRPHGEIIRRFPSSSKMKYVWPSGSRNALDIHPGARSQLHDRSVPIIVTEGVKKGDAVLSASIAEGIECVVVSINGCWGWRVKVDGGGIAAPDFADIPLEDRKCYLLVDSDLRSNDDVMAGWFGLAQYLESKTGEHRVLITTVPPNGREKQGADDFLVEGGTLDQLLGLGSTPRQGIINEDPDHRPLATRSALRLITEAPETIPHLITPILPERAVMVLAGHSGTFKTWHALGLALDGAFGLKWLDHPDFVMRTTPFTTLYVNKEMGGSLLANRLRKLAANPRYRERPEFLDVLDSRIHMVDEASLDLVSAPQRDRLEAAIMDLGAELVVLDSLSMCWSGNEDSNSEVGALYAKLREITERTGCSWAIIHHLLKPPLGSKKLPTKFAIRGAGQIVQQADALVVLSPFEQPEGTPPADRTAYIQCEVLKARSDREPDPFVSMFATTDTFAAVSYGGSLATATAQTYAKSGDPGKATSWVAQALGGLPGLAPQASGLRTRQLILLLQQAWPLPDSAPPSEQTIRRRLDELVADNTLEVVDHDRQHGSLYRFHVDSPLPALASGDGSPAAAGLELGSPGD